MAAKIQVFKLEFNRWFQIPSHAPIQNLALKENPAFNSWNNETRITHYPRIHLIITQLETMDHYFSSRELLKSVYIKEASEKQIIEQQIQIHT